MKKHLENLEKTRSPDLRISIVTISYNQAEYLGECIESVLNQNYPNLEYIVVDPGSKDGSREIIECYGEKIKKVFESDDGPADGLAKGLRMATGEVCGFINADDLLLPGSLDYVKEIFLNQSVKYFTGICIERMKGRSDRFLYPSKLTYGSLMYRSARVLQPSTFFRKTLYLKAGEIDSKNRTCWDYDIFLRMSKICPSHQIQPRALSVFRLHPSSISSQGITSTYLKEMNSIYKRECGKDWGGKTTFLSFLLRVYEKALVVYYSSRFRFSKEKDTQYQ